MTKPLSDIQTFTGMLFFGGANFLLQALLTRFALDLHGFLLFVAKGFSMQVNSNADLSRINSAFSDHRANRYDYGTSHLTEDFASKRRREANKWAKIWFEKLCRFHRKPISSSWCF